MGVAAGDRTGVRCRVIGIFRFVLQSLLLALVSLTVASQGEQISREDIKLGTIVGVVPRDSETASSRLMTTYAAKGASKRLSYLHFVVIVEDLAFEGEKSIVSGTTSSRLTLLDSKSLLRNVRQMLALAARQDNSSHRHLEWSNNAGFVARYIESDLPPRLEIAVDGRSKWVRLDMKGVRRFEDQLARGIVWMNKRR